MTSRRLALVLAAALLSATPALAQVVGAGVGQQGSVTTNDGACWASPGLIKDCGFAPGNVAGPGSAVSGDVATFNGTTGKIIQDSGIPTTGLPTARGQLPGTTTNDTATAGNVGDIIQSTVAQASPISITTTGVSQNVTSVVLTGGDWRCWGNIGTAPNGATTTAGMAAALSQVTNTLPTPPNGGAYNTYNSIVGAGSALVLPTGAMRVSTTGTTLYLVINVSFSVNAMGAFGYLGCERAR